MHLTRKKTSPGHTAQSGDVLIQIVMVSRIRVGRSRFVVLLCQPLRQLNDILTRVLAHIAAAALAHGFQLSSVLEQTADRLGCLAAFL